MNPLRLVIAGTVAAIVFQPLCAQDLLAVTWNGAVVRVDSYTAAVTPLGTGSYGQNALARANDGTFWSTARIQSSWYFTILDPNTGAIVSTSYSGTDVRALATGPGNLLYGIRDNTYGGDMLLRIDVTNGVPYIVGYTGYADIQGLSMHQGVLYAWDVFQGLLVVDPLTGVATDPFPGVGGPAYQQSLCSHPDGRLLLGGGDSNGPDQLFVVDPTTGIATLIGDMNGATDIRGIEPIGGYAQPIAHGCAGAYGPVTLSILGLLEPGGSLASQSDNHAPGAFGVVIFGFDTASYQGHTLPYSLDAMLGTVDCWLAVRPDVMLPVPCNGVTPALLQHGFPLTAAAAGAVFHMQHAALDPVPGGVSWSNGVSVHIR